MGKDSAEERFVVEFKARGWVAGLNQAARHVVNAAWGYDAVPLVVAPYISPKVCEAVEAEGANWLDLSGNASIRTDRRTILVTGRQNRFPDSDRRKTLGVAGERIARLLLIHPNQTWRQVELAETAHVAQSSVSRAVQWLTTHGMADDVPGGVRIANAPALLDVLAASTHRAPNREVQGVIAARTGPEAAERVAGHLSDTAGLKYGLTGLAGAWAYDRFADFQSASLLLGPEAATWNDDHLREVAGLRSVERGANVRLWVASDPTVLEGQGRIGDVSVAHPVQVYLDLQRESGRAREAADELRRNHLGYTWR